MANIDNCREFFLKGVTDIYVYSLDASVIPQPFSVPNIRNLSGCEFGDPLLHVSICEDSEIVGEKLSAKASMAKDNFGWVYSFVISAEIMLDYEILANVLSSLNKKACCVLLKVVDGTVYLCYAVPDSFKCVVTSSMSMTSFEHSLRIVCQSLSSFIPLAMPE